MQEHQPNHQPQKQQQQQRQLYTVLLLKVCNAQMFLINLTNGLRRSQSSQSSQSSKSSSSSSSGSGSSSNSSNGSCKLLSSKGKMKNAFASN